MTTAVVLLHGFTGCPSSFDTVVTSLRGTTIETPVLVGHGGAESDARVTGFESEVDRIAALLSKQKTRWHIAGYSLGGRIALGVVVRHPDLCASATLIGAQPGLTSESERDARVRADERLCRLLEGPGIEAFVAEWDALPLFATQARLPADTLARQRSARLALDPKGLARSLRLTGLGAMPSYWDDLGRVLIPTTLMVGEDDSKFTEIARRMAERMPRAAVEVVPRSGHNVVLERPDAVAAAIRRAVGSDS